MTTVARIVEVLDIDASTLFPNGEELADVEAELATEPEPVKRITQQQRADTEVWASKRFIW